MNTDAIKYLKFNEIDRDDFLSLLNRQKVREHLIPHNLFNKNTVASWINSKIEVDNTVGCRVRAIIYQNKLAGWCGIQLEDEKYEIAIIIDDQYWGLGKKVFLKAMDWAKELGHDEIYLHLLHTRPEYKFLEKLSVNMYKTDLLGNTFTTYQLQVN